MQHLFNRTSTSVMIGIALCTITGISHAAYQVRDPAIGAEDTVGNIDGTSDVTISVLDNDGINADPNTLVIATNPAKGSVAISGENIVYTPNAGFSGTDSFTYRIREIDWRNSPSSVTQNLTGVISKRPIANSYVDDGVPSGSSPIHDGQTNQPPAGFWNQNQLSNGVVGKSYSPNSASNAFPGCNSEDTNVPAISLDVVWSAERGRASASGNMFTMTSATSPTPLGNSPDIVLKSNPFENSQIALNGSSIQTTSGDIATTIEDWEFTATGKWVDLTPDQFETMNVSILASTVSGKTWFVQGTSLEATIDYSQCSLHTATVEVTVSDSTIVVDPGDPDILDEDNDGIPDIVEGSQDTDGDGLADFLDLDSDNDSITDIVEAGGVDSNFDGKVDNATDANNDGQDDNVRLANPTDTDGDGIPNFREVDSNGDGTFDIAETSEAAADTVNTDGMRDNFSDNNQDGLDDALLGNQVTLNDSDANGTPDFAEVAETSSGGGGGSWGVVPNIALALLAFFGIRKRRNT